MNKDDRREVNDALLSTMENLEKAKEIHETMPTILDTSKYLVDLGKIITDNLTDLSDEERTVMWQNLGFDNQDPLQL